MPLQSFGHSGDQIDGLEPQRMNNWSLEIPFNDINDGTNIIVLSLQTFQLPTESTDPIEIYYMNEQRSYAGRTRYDGGTLSLTDWIDKGTVDVVNQWRRQVYDPATGRVGLKTEYAKEGNLYLYPPGSPGTTGANAAPVFTRQWQLQGLWPESVSWGPLDMAASEKVQIDVTLRYDKAILVTSTTGGI